MQTFTSLKKTEDFGRVYRQGRSYGNKLLVMYVLEKGQGQEGRLGISVSKKVGNRVVRHRIRRLVRESFRLHLSEWSGTADIVVVARREAKGKTFFEIEKALISLGTRSGAFRISKDPLS